MKLKWAETTHQRMGSVAHLVGNVLVDGFHYLALFAIGGAIVWSAVVAFSGMATKGHASIDDILLLFIYLELGAMVGIYFKTNHMPVRFLIYVAMTALTRLLISDVQAHHSPETGIVVISGAILLLALATLVIRYGSAKFPSGQSDGRD
jgi:protein PsiE